MEKNVTVVPFPLTSITKNTFVMLQESISFSKLAWVKLAAYPTLFSKLTTLALDRKSAQSRISARRFSSFWPR
jgi:hypothetical protein